jgi:hypothetical protein
MDKPIITQGRACQNFQRDNSHFKRTSILSPRPSSGKPSSSLTFFTFERAAAYIEWIYTWLLGNILLLHTTDGRKEHRTEASSLPAL